MLIRGTVQAAVHDHFAVLGTWHPWLRQRLDPADQRTASQVDPSLTSWPSS